MTSIHHPKATRSTKKPSVSAPASDIVRADKSRPSKKAKDKTRKDAVTTHKLVWRDITCRVRRTPNYISKGWTHLELIVVTPKGAPVPITTTGYLSHFLDEDLLAKNGGPVAFFLAWIEREARTPKWAKTEFKWRQLELFPR